MLAAILIFSFQAKAQLVFRTAFIGQNPTPDCYKLYIVVLKQHPEFLTMGASEAEAWYQKGDCPPEKVAVSLGTKPDCTAFLLNGVTFTTGKDASKCLQEYMNDDAAKEALQASMDFSLGHLKGFKGMKTSVVRGLLAYPIPAHNYLNIATGFKDIHDALAVITDISGNEMFKMGLQNPGSEAFTLCLKDFEPGSYFLTIAAGSKEIAKQTILVQ